MKIHFGRSEIRDIVQVIENWWFLDDIVIRNIVYALYNIQKIQIKYISV